MIVNKKPFMVEVLPEFSGAFKAFNSLSNKVSKMNNYNYWKKISFP